MIASTPRQCPVVSTLSLILYWIVMGAARAARATLNTLLRLSFGIAVLLLMGLTRIMPAAFALWLVRKIC